MAAEHFPVSLVNHNDDIAKGLFTLDEDADAEAAHLKFSYPGGEKVSTASDYFEAMCRIRIELMSEGWYLMCYGGSRNVYPSGMGRDMGRGLKAYKMELGRHAEMADLVCIFQAGPDLLPASVEEQKAFFQLWLRTPKVFGGGRRRNPPAGPSSGRRWSAAQTGEP